MKIKCLNDYLLNGVFYEYDNENFHDFLIDIDFEFNIPFIHISGTSGKTIISNVLFNIYDNSDYKVGLFSSDFDKNSIVNAIKIKNKEIDFEYIDEIFKEYIKPILKYNLTIFEIVFFVSLVAFKKNNVELVVIDSKIGGYFDTTNVLDNPNLVVINNVGLEHSDLLGKSISEIALSKSGLIKKECSVLLNSLDEEINYIVNEVARKQKAKLYKVSEFYKYDLINEKLNIAYYPYPNFIVNSYGLYNRENIACCLEVVNILSSLFQVNNEQIQKGLSLSFGEPYFEKSSINGKNIIIDRANNAYSIEKLCKSIEYEFSDSISNSIIIFAVDYEKNVEKMLSIISHLTHNIVLTTYEDDNARDEDGFFLFLDDYSFTADYKNFIKNILNNDDIKNIFITGNEKFAVQASKFVKGIK